MSSLPSSLSLSGRTAIVTGGSRGIGKAISIELARRGANVALIYVQPSKAYAAEETVREILALSPAVRAVSILADIANLAAPARIVSITLSVLGVNTIDILVHNASAFSHSALQDITPEHYEHMMNTNIRGPLMLTKEALPHMSNGGRIIFVSSIASRMPEPSLINSLYAGSKAACDSFVRSWSFEV